MRKDKERKKIVIRSKTRSIHRNRGKFDQEKEHQNKNQLAFGKPRPRK